MAEAMTEQELIAKYEGKIEANTHVKLKAVKTSDGKIINVGDFIIEDGEIYRVDTITFDPWNKIQFWVYRSNAEGRPLDNELLLFRPEESTKGGKE